MKNKEYIKNKELSLDEIIKFMKRCDVVIKSGYCMEKYEVDVIDKHECVNK